MEDYHNLNLARTISRSDYYPDYNWFTFWDDCRSFAYAANEQYISPVQIMHYILNDRKEIRILTGLTSICATTPVESKIHYFNISDSWVDVSLWSKIPSGDWRWEREDWRVYGTNPDPWDAPDLIKNKHISWPPSGENTEWKIEVCEHLSSHTAGGANYPNVINENDIYSTSIPIETAIAAVKGAWSGLRWQTDSHNEFIHKIVSPQISRIRIEKISGYHRIYIQFSNGTPVGWEGNDFVDLITNYGEWVTNPYIYIFDVLDNQTIMDFDYGQNISIPNFNDESVLYDSYFSTNRGVKIMPIQPYTVLNETGIAQFETIINEQKQYFRDRGWKEDYIENRTSVPLVKKLII